MTVSQIYSAYLLWLGDDPPRPFQNIFDFPVADCDVFEDEHSMINRLFFLIPHTRGGSLRCFSFFEENAFSKDSRGDLTLLHSSFHITS